MVKMSVLPKGIYGFNPYWNPNNILCRYIEAHPKIYMESQGMLNSQNILEKEEKSWWKQSHFLVSKLFTKLQWSKQDSTGIKITSKMNGMDEIENPVINPHIHNYMIFDKGAKIIKKGKDS